MHTTFIVLASIALGIQIWVIFVSLFGPDLPYRIRRNLTAPLDSDYYGSQLAVLTDAQLHSHNRIEVLTNGDCFYAAELTAIREARATINLEAYIFHEGEIGALFRDALIERARAGVEVKLIIDFIGSFGTSRHYFNNLTAAGGQLRWYHSLRPDVALKINNRTHRELLIVDGKVGFIGGAGIADQWYRGSDKNPRWRDTVVRVEGPVVASLQSVFAQNWLRTAGEVLTGEDYFSFEAPDDGSDGLVVGSTPAEGATRARILFQMLITAAQKRIYISTPYFLPDAGGRAALIDAVQKRNVEVIIMTPGKHSDQPVTRSSSRRLYGSLLKSGVQIREYEAAMIHVKAMMIDDTWAVVGSTNFDHRSFELNDEVNLAICDSRVARRLTEDFFHDLKSSKRVTYEEWRKEKKFRFYEWFESLLDKEQ